MELFFHAELKKRIGILREYGKKVMHHRTE